MQVFHINISNQKMIIHFFRLQTSSRTQGWILPLLAQTELQHNWFWYICSGNFDWKVMWIIINVIENRTFFRAKIFDQRPALETLIIIQVKYYFYHLIIQHLPGNNWEVINSSCLFLFKWHGFCSQVSRKLVIIFTRAISFKVANEHKQRLYFKTCSLVYSWTGKKSIKFTLYFDRSWWETCGFDHSYCWCQSKRNIKLTLYSNKFVQVLLDYLKGTLGPPLDDLKYLPAMFNGVVGTHRLAGSTLRALQKFSKKKYSCHF